jgi:hypothetical protein
MSTELAMLTVDKVTDGTVSSSSFVVTPRLRRRVHKSSYTHAGCTAGGDCKSRNIDLEAKGADEIVRNAPSLPLLLGGRR